MTRVVIDIPDSIDLSKVNDIKLYLNYYKNNNEYSYVTDGFTIQEERPQGKCKNCIHRDPEDKKCDCGGIERRGCPFSVSDDYYCKYYEQGG